MQDFQLHTVFSVIKNNIILEIGKESLPTPRECVTHSFVFFHYLQAQEGESMFEFSVYIYSMEIT